MGRRWNVDPEANVWESPYLTFNDNPISRVDPLGLKGENNIYKDNKTGKTITVKTNEHGDRVFHGDIKQGADITNLKISDFDLHGSTDLNPEKGYKYDPNSDQFVSGNPNSNSVVPHNNAPIIGHAVIPPSQASINTKPQPAPATSTTEQKQKKAENTEAVAAPVGLLATATSGVETLNKYAVGESKVLEVVGETTVKGMKSFGQKVALADIGINYLQYKAGNISGLHASINIAMDFIGFWCPAVPLVWGLADSFFGHSIFDDDPADRKK